MSLIASLKASLSLETAQFEAGAKRAQRQARTTAQSINRSLSTIKAIGAGFISGLSVGLLSQGIKAALDYAGSLGEVSQQLGVTTKDLQVFRYAAGQLGVSQEQLETGLSKLTITLGKVAAGAKAPAAALKAIGIEAKDLAGLDTGEAFRKIADGLAKIPDRAQRAAVEVALFGKSGAQLDTLLSGGSSALNELARAAEELGIVLSDRQIQQADETADKLEAVKTVLAANIAGVVADNAQAIVGLAQSLATLTSEIIKFLNSNPQVALGIIGALAGGRVGGLPGAAAGAIAGIAVGERIAINQRNSNTDLSFRKQQFQAARARYDAAKKNRSTVIRGDRGETISDGEKAFQQALQGLQRETALYRQAKATNQTPQPVPSGTIAPFLASGGGSGRGKKDRSAEEAERLRQQQLRDAYQFDQDQRRGQMDILRAQESLAVNADDRAQLQLQILDLERQGEQVELDYQIASGEISAEQAAILAAQKDRRVAIEKQAIADELTAQKAEDEGRAIEQRFEIQRNALEAQRNLATTAEERRKLSLEILKLEYDEKRELLERTVANDKLTDAIRQRAQAELDAMPNQYALDQQGVRQQTQGPLESYISGLPSTAEQWNEALQGVAVNGLQSIEDGLVSIIDGTKSVGQAFKDMARGIINDLLRIVIRKTIVLPLANALLGGFSKGGPVGFASGGWVSGPGTGTSDSIPAMLSNGEFVVNAKATKRFMPLLEAINMGCIPALAGGGLPIARVSHAQRVSIGTGDNYGRGMTVNAPITIQGNASRETTMQMGAKLRTVISGANRKGA